MDRETKRGSDLPGQRPCARRSPVALLRLDERHHLGRELVSALRSARLRQQAGEALLCKGRFRLVEGRTRDAKERRGRGFLDAIDTDVAKHFVLHLDQVARVEEAAGLEPRCANGLGMAVQGTLLPQTLGLGVALAQSGLLLDIDVM